MTYGNTGNSVTPLVVSTAFDVDLDVEMSIVDDVPPPQHVELIGNSRVATDHYLWTVACWSCYRSIDTRDLTEAVGARIRHDRTCADLGIACRHPKVEIITYKHAGQAILRCTSDTCRTQIGTWLAPKAPQL